jgi:hypothetical protein
MYQQYPQRPGRPAFGVQRSRIKEIPVRRRLFSLICVLGLGLSSACYAWPYNTRPHTYAAALGDLDAYLANGENEGVVKDTVWSNDGSGTFYDSVQQPFEAETHFVAPGEQAGLLSSDSAQEYLMQPCCV